MTPVEASVHILKVVQRAVMELPRGTNIDQVTVILGMAEALGDLIAVSGAPHELLQRAIAKIEVQARSDKH